VLASEGQAPAGDKRWVDHVRERLEGGYSAAIAVGSGTINDLVKLAAAQVGVAYGVVATAASMNGYTSSIAAIYANKLKRTLPAAPPLWVVADLDVLTAAPLEMTRAGLADLMSKPSSSADWRAASLVLNEYYCDMCADLAGRAEEACRAQAASIGQGAPEAVALLAAGLILSGISMAMAGSSAPASGGEHLISHVWDMRRLHEGRPHALHGAQAGLGTLMTASLWELLPATPRPDEASISQIVSSRPSWADEVAEINKRLGPLAEAAVEEYRAKRPSDVELRRRLEYLAGNWDYFWGEVGRLLRPVTELRTTLVRASAPVTAKELGLSPEEARSAFCDARYVRSRYTVFDLAADLGVLDDLLPKALELSGVLE
jgi:glycerol-1-phosphate dehydrogenase [NAD(P)+]